MTRIQSQEHAERITRDAAAAIGRDIRHWPWNAVLHGLRDPETPLIGIEPDRFFAPLHEAAHAYELETTLCMNIAYKWQTNGSILLQLTSTAHGGAIMYTLTREDDPMRVRREAVTVFASLSLIMDCHEDKALMVHG